MFHGVWRPGFYAILVVCGMISLQRKSAAQSLPNIGVLHSRHTA
jgi:hypothetical protein